MQNALVRIAVGFGVAAALGAGGAWAQAYPTKPIRILIPFPAGGPADLFGRIVGQKLSESWGQPVVAENRPGATGTIGTAQVVKSTPDGYTLLMASTSSHVSPYLYQNQPFDPNRDLEPIINVVTLPFYLVGHASFPANTLQELVAEVKKKPAFYTFASPGAGSGGHLVMEMLRAAAGLDLIHVPFKGAAPAVGSTVAGQTMLVFDTISTSQPHVKGGKLKPFVVSTNARSAAVPDVPTVKESGYPNFEATIWFGLFAPSGTPSAIVNRINAEVTRIMQTDEMKNRVAGIAGEFTPNTATQFRDFARVDTERWREVIKSTGAKAD